MTSIGVDLNATRLRAVHGSARGPAPLALDADRPELPLALSLESRLPAVGRAGLEICRKLPHLACVDFLPHLGRNRQWNAGRHSFDAAKALGLICQHVQPRLAQAGGIVLGLPAYLEEQRVDLVSQVAQRARWKILGVVPAPLAAVLAACRQLPWNGLVVVVDVDGHALTYSAVALAQDRARLVGVRPVPRLALGCWMQALIDGVARRCVRMSRRDPRASAEAEQLLFEQLLAVLESGKTDALVELNIRSGQWFQNLMLPAEELAAFLQPLANLARMQFLEFLGELTDLGSAGAVIFTCAAGRLPGLASALGDRDDAATAAPEVAEGDFGAALLDETLSPAIHVLDADAVARSTWELAARFQSRELARGWHDELPLPAREIDTFESGPPRLHFAGRDHVLSASSFTLGRDPACDISFTSENFPSVSARHCEIFRDQRGYVLRDRSRHGTLINDRAIQGQASLKPGDWIRLGPGGPLLRFFGRPGDPLQLVTA